MNYWLSIVSFVMLSSCVEIYPMFRSILKSNAVDHAMASGMVAGVLGLTSSAASKFFTKESVATCANDIIAATAVCALAGTAITAPVYFGWDSFQESGHHGMDIDRFRHGLSCDALRSLKTLTFQPENASAMNDLLQAQWALNKFDTHYNDLINVEGLSLGVAPCVVVPMSLTFLVQTGGTEMFVAGMSLSYLLAAAAVMQEKLQSHRIKKAMKECNFFDKNTITPEFIEKNKAMVARLCTEFQPIKEDYKNHTHWAVRQTKEKGEFYYPNINERINAFDKVIKSELECFNR